MGGRSKNECHLQQVKVSGDKFAVIELFGNGHTGKWSRSGADANNQGDIYISRADFFKRRSLLQVWKRKFETDVTGIISTKKCNTPLTP